MYTSYRADKYTYRILWSHETQSFVGHCTEFPELSIGASTHDEALKCILSKVENQLSTLRLMRQDAPIPLSISMFRRTP